MASTKLLMKECTLCHQSFTPESFIKVHSIFFPDDRSPICTDCLEKIVRKDDPTTWANTNKICQWLDIPFIPSEWEKLYKVSKERSITAYSQIKLRAEYKTVDWDEFNQHYLDLEEDKRLDEEMPELAAAKRKQLEDKWGPEYDEESIDYLEQLYNGILQTQSVSTPLQIDQAQKLCKISLQIDQKIRAGEDFKQLMSGYDSFIKAADLTPKNMRSMSDFESTGELFMFLEKSGWKNRFYDGATRDIVDETLKNIQANNRRLYVNENGIAEEIEKRLEILKSAKDFEAGYRDDFTEELDSYEMDGMKIVEEFDPDA